MNRELMAVQSELYYILSIGLRLPTRELADQVQDGGFRRHMLDLSDGKLPDREEESPGIVMEESRAFLLELREIWMPRLMAGTERGQELFHALRTEYTRLFSVPKQARFSLYESVAREKSRLLFENPVAHHAETCYRRAGLQIENRQQEPADYLPTELEFASILTAKLAGAETGLELGEDECEALWEEFYSRHLKDWLTDYWSAVAEETTDDFYGKLARTGGLLARKG